jgi:hypothetical protein
MTMAIFGVGAFYDRDVSQDFIQANLVGVGWSLNDAPELHQFMRSLKVGDVVYIKASPPPSPDICVKAIGIISNGQIRNAANSNNLVQCGRNVRWVHTKEFRVPRPAEKNNVRFNTMYEEFHPDVQRVILAHL